MKFQSPSQHHLVELLRPQILLGAAIFGPFFGDSGTLSGAKKATFLQFLEGFYTVSTGNKGCTYAALTKGKNPIGLRRDKAIPNQTRAHEARVVTSLFMARTSWLDSQQALRLEPPRSGGLASAQCASPNAGKKRFSPISSVDQNSETRLFLPL
ncbi:hypothetical protein M8J76_017189 [Diaphorina citri]|nr:hypothetical protein M8J76_017189 [Diaphorina citri]KAI5735939.1 hypothetical protein M8J77_024472 [Diaphorina citri]